MKSPLKLLAVGTTLAVASLSAQAQDNFVGLTWGETSNNIQRSNSLKAVPETRGLDGTINNSSTWGVRGGQQTEAGRMYVTYENVSDTYSSRYKFRQHNLLGSYDAFLPVGETTNLYGGATAGVVKLVQDSPATHRSSDLGLAAGLQVGVLQQVGTNASIEAGYRYMRTTLNASLDARDGSVGGHFDVKSSKQAFLGLNYHF